MPLNIKNAEVERLAAEVARLTGESKTEAIRRALDERKRRLKGSTVADRRTRVIKFLERKVWPTIPKDQLGRRLTRAPPRGTQLRRLPRLCHRHHRARYAPLRRRQLRSHRHRARVTPGERLRPVRFLESAPASSAAPAGSTRSRRGTSRRARRAFRQW